MDVHTKQQRSYNMSRIKGSGTKPEIRFRKYIWKQGIRGYRVKSVVRGKPDLYFPKNKVAVFIDGCFWHKCPQCFREPQSNKDFWSEKINKNMQRDLQVNKLLHKQNIREIRFWEHEVKQHIVECYDRLREYLQAAD